MDIKTCTQILSFGSLSIYIKSSQICFLVEENRVNCPCLMNDITSFPPHQFFYTHFRLWNVEVQNDFAAAKKVRYASSCPTYAYNKHPLPVTCIFFLTTCKNPNNTHLHRPQIIYLPHSACLVRKSNVRMCLREFKNVMCYNLMTQSEM